MSTKGINYYMRAIHRDLGFLAIGLCLVYALSGVVLIYRDTDFMKHNVENIVVLRPQLSAEGLGTELKIRGFKATQENDSLILFNGGTYDKATGVASYTTGEIIKPFNKLISLHKVASQSAVHWFGVFFCLILFLLALTSFWMFRVKTKQFRRGMIITALGVVITVVVLLIL